MSNSRVLVIYAAWKISKENKSTFWSIFGSENKSLSIVLLFSAGLTILLIFTGDYFYTFYRTLDWYSGDSVVAMTIFNLTYYHMVESLILLVCYVAHRHYPQEFNIKGEILLVSIISWIFNNHLEIYSVINAQNKDKCMFGLLDFNAVGDIIRALGFVTALSYVTHRSMFYFPLPFTWIFKDLSKFIFEPTCIKVFRMYLEKKEPDGRFKLQ